MASSTATFSVSVGEVRPRSGVSIAIGFEPGTVVQPTQRIPNAFLELGPWLLGSVAILFAIIGRISHRLFLRRARRGTGIVIAQFEVADSLPPLIAATLLPRPQNVIPAEIVHQAVRGMLKIYDDDSQPRLRRITGADAPDPLDAVAHQELFKKADADGDVTIPESSDSFGKRMARLTARGYTTASSRGLVQKRRSTVAVVVCAIALGLSIIGIATGIWGVGTGRPIATGALMLAVFTVIIAFAVGKKATAKSWVPTPDGALAYEHLLGVKEFIRVAEADRLRMLQSYSGAERRNDGTIDVIHLYEKLLPYAMLFGLEQEWGEVLEVNYASTGQSASWTTTSPMRFVPAMTAFTLATANSASYRRVTSSSTSSSGGGGSSGGGFSGGGGGGGFSGGR